MIILHAAETIKGGVATVINLLASGTLREEPSSEIYCLVPSNQITELTAIPKDRILPFKYTARGFRGAISFAIAFVKTVLSLKPDVVHLHSSFAGALGRICLLFIRPLHRCRVIYCPHAFSFLIPSGKFRNYIFGLIERQLCFISDAVICVSKYEYEIALNTGLSVQKLFLIRNGIEFRSYINRDDSLHPQLPIRLLFVGRLDFQKGFDVLLRALDILDPTRFHLTVIGSPVHGTPIPVMPSNVDYLPWVPREFLFDYYCNADVLIMPSRWEGFAMTPLEAMSCGLPVLCSDHPSLIELVRPGIDGALFKCNDPNSLANELTARDNVTWSKFGLNAHDSVSSNFSADQMVRQTVKLYY